MSNCNQFEYHGAVIREVARIIFHQPCLRSGIPQPPEIVITGSDGACATYRGERIRGAIDALRRGQGLTPEEAKDAHTRLSGMMSEYLRLRLR